MSAFGEKCVIMASRHQMDTDTDKLTNCQEQFSNLFLQEDLELLPFHGFAESEVPMKKVIVSDNESDVEVGYQVLDSVEKEAQPSEAQKVSKNVKATSKSGSKRETKSKHLHWLIGTATDVLKEDFITALKNDVNLDFSDWLPFTGPKRLPTKIETLKLYLFMMTQLSRDIRFRLESSNI